jgi:hypothetical protein
MQNDYKKFQNDKDKVINKGTQDFINYNNSMISNFFTWFNIKRIQCIKCSNNIYSFQNYSTFDLNLIDVAKFKKNQSLTLSDCLELYQVDQIKHNIFCEFCKGYNLISAINFFKKQSISEWIVITPGSMGEELILNLENFQCIKNYNNLLFDYHICFYGLDNERYTNFELIDEIFHEIKSTITRFSKEDIQILDEQSVLTYCLLNNINEIKTDKFYNYGRFALVKFKNDKDALRIYLEKTVLHLPLINQRNGSPFMIMGGLLKKYIEE